MPGLSDVDLVVLTQLVLLVAGGWFALRCISSVPALFGPSPRPHPQMAPFMRTFRLSMLAFALAGGAVGWMLDQVWLICMAVAIGGEETIETTLLLDGINRGARLRLRP